MLQTESSWEIMGEGTLVGEVAVRLHDMHCISPFHPPTNWSGLTITFISLYCD